MVHKKRVSLIGRIQLPFERELVRIHEGFPRTTLHLPCSLLFSTEYMLQFFFFREILPSVWWDETIWPKLCGPSHPYAICNLHSFEKALHYILQHGSFSAFQFVPRMFSEVVVGALCRPFEFFSTPTLPHNVFIDFTFRIKAFITIVCLKMCS